MYVCTCGHARTPVAPAHDAARLGHLLVARPHDAVPAHTTQTHSATAPTPTGSISPLLCAAVCQWVSSPSVPLVSSLRLVPVRVEVDNLRVVDGRERRDGRGEVHGVEADVARLVRLHTTGGGDQSKSRAQPKGGAQPKKRGKEHRDVACLQLSKEQCDSSTLYIYIEMKCRQDVCAYLSVGDARVLEEAVGGERQLALHHHHELLGDTPATG